MEEYLIVYLPSRKPLMGTSLLLLIIVIAKGILAMDVLIYTVAFFLTIRLSGVKSHLLFEVMHIKKAIQNGRAYIPASEM